jgi:hypothetical protein
MRALDGLRFRENTIGIEGTALKGRNNFQMGLRNKSFTPLVRGAKSGWNQKKRGDRLDDHLGAMNM